MRRRIEGGRFVGRRCVVSLDDRLLRVRSVRHPRMTDEETDRAVRLDAGARLGFSEHEALEVGWLRAGEVRQGDELREEVLIVGCPRGPVEMLVMELARCGLRAEAVEPGFQACARVFGRTLRRAEDQSLVRVLIDIGWRSTGVIITRGRSVGFFKPLEMGGAVLNEAVGQRLGLDASAVADLRRQRMTEGSASTIDRKVDRAVFEAVRPLLGELAREVALCLRYYGVTFRGARPEECLLVGGESREPRLTELVADELRVTTNLGRPLHGVLPGDEASGARDADLAVAAGLGLREWEQADNKRVGRRPGEARRSAEGTPGQGAPGGKEAA